jgi:OmpA-OmpF porin, OOP family
MNTIRKLLALAAFAVTGSAQAADAPGAYLLVGGGASHYNTDCAGTTKCDNNGNAFKFVGGYRFGNAIAAEIVSYNFGKAQYSVPGANLELKGTALGGGAAVYAELAPNWVGTIRLGIASVKMKGTVPNVGSTSDSSTNAYAGLALAYQFTPAVSAEVAWDSTKGKVAGTSGNLSALTVGVGVKF